MQIGMSFPSPVLGDGVKSMKSSACQLFVKTAEGNASVCKANAFYKEFVITQLELQVITKINGI